MSKQHGLQIKNKIWAKTQIQISFTFFYLCTEPERVKWLAEDQI